MGSKVVGDGGPIRAGEKTLENAKKRDKLDGRK